MEDKEKMYTCDCKDCKCEDVDTTDVEEVEEDYGEFEPVEFPIYFDTKMVILSTTMNLIVV